jgi:hypothetical protein
MIQMRVRYEDVIDHTEFSKAQLTDARTSVYQHIVIEQE